MNNFNDGDETLTVIGAYFLTSKNDKVNSIYNLEAHSDFAKRTLRSALKDVGKMSLLPEWVRSWHAYNENLKECILRSGHCCKLGLIDDSPKIRQLTNDLLSIGESFEYYPSVTFPVTIK